ncbi:flavoprotein-domain-containing protein, partial [Baffinella frigidus]
PRILVAATGSVASVKVPELVEALIQCFGEATQIKVVTTPAGAAMLRLCQGYNPSAWTKMSICSLSPGTQVAVLVDADEWEGFDDIRTDKVVHIELRRWADCLIIAPCSACTLSKLATGVCDNLLTSLARAWDPSKALILAPAMNTVKPAIHSVLSAVCSSASLGLAGHSQVGYSQVDGLRWRYKPVNFGAEKRPGSPNG